VVLVVAIVHAVAAPQRSPVQAASTSASVRQTTGHLDGTWTRYTRANAPLASDAVRDVAVDGAGTVWIRVSGTGDAPDQVIAVSARAEWQAYPALRDAVEDRHDRIVALGTVPDLWAVDGARRVWTGAEYFDGRWRSLVGGDSPLTYSSRVLLDAGGTAWVPFGTCARPDTCGVDGLAAFAADGPLDRLVRFETVPEAGQYGVPDVSLVPGPAGAGTVRGGGWAVARRKLYALPDETPVAYPLLGLDPPPASRNAGYATAAALRPDGSLVVFTWVEIHDDRDIYHKILANPWLGSGWSESDDLTAAPPFPAGVEYVRVAAAAYDPPAVTPTGEVLWVAASTGEIAVRRDGTWIARFGPADMGLAAAPAIRDLVVAPDGTTWVATDKGVLKFERAGRGRRTLHLPRVANSRRR
jgi:hypothetical protein